MAPRGKVISLMDALRKSVGSVAPDEVGDRAAGTGTKKKAEKKGITLIKSDAAPKTAKAAKRKTA